MSILQDTRFSIRLLVKNRWFTLTAVIALGLGIGANNTVFTCVNAVLLRGLPYEHPERIMHLASRNTASGNEDGISLPDFREMRAEARAFVDLAAFQSGTMNVADDGQPPERLSGAWVSANAFSLLGQRLALGRDFLPQEDRAGAERVVILGHGVWTDRYGANPDILGRSVKINEIPATVVGVMPEGMKFPMNADLWQPLVPAPRLERRDLRLLEVFGPLRAGTSIAAARAEMSTITGRLARQYPETNRDIDTTVLNYNERYNGGRLQVYFGALMGAVGFVLLIACANVANLLLARSTVRARELAVRMAVGATRMRILRQLLIESLCLAFLAGGLGLALSCLGVRLFDRATADLGKPYWIQFTMDFRVFGFLGFICLATAVLFGLAPALKLSQSEVGNTLKEGARGSAGGSRRFTSILVATQLALAVVLLTGAGMMIRSFLALYSMNFGIRADRILTVALTLAQQKYPQPGDAMKFHDRLAERLDSAPGIASAAIATALPLGGGDRRLARIEGRPSLPGTQQPEVTVVAVGARFFEVLDVGLLRGRDFRRDDGRPGTESAIVNQRFAAQFMPGENPIGRHIWLAAEGRAESAPLTIVGVAPNIRQQSPADTLDEDAVVYVPFRQEPGRFAFILARGTGRPASLTPVLREEVRAVDPSQPVYRAMTLADVMARARWPYRVFGGLLGVFALIALVLSTIGIYAVTAYSVTQRRREIGVRMALGARSGQISSLIMKSAAARLATGLLAGFAAAAGLCRLIRGLLVRSTVDDPLTYAAVVLIFTAVTAVAGFTPSYRAARVDPVEVLRTE